MLSEHQMTMTLRRRWPVLVVLTLIVLFLVQKLDFLQFIPSLPENEPSAPYTPEQPIGDDRFHWEKLPLRYPVSSYTRLPINKRTLPRVQHAFARESTDQAVIRQKGQQEVKSVLQRCWSSYRERAWLSDELAPVSGSKKDTFGGWAATLADTLDTLWIADLKDEFHDGVEALLEIDFTKISQGEINVFETTIRYLGGFISAFDLSGDRRLLDKAIEVAEMLYIAFDTPNRMPITRWNVRDAAAGKPQLAGEGVLVAEIGSLSLEFTRLAQITHNDKWYDCIDRIMQIFDRQQGSSNIPGKWPLVVNARTQDFASGDHFTLAAMADSLYEYLPKMYALLGGSSLYAKMYEDAMDTAIRETVFRPMVPDNADILLSGSARSERKGESRLDPQGQHLVCFAGGMLALGGRLLENQTHVELGRKLTDGCIWTYEATPLGIMPEVFDMLPCQLGSECPWDEGKWQAGVLEKAGQDAGADAAGVIQRERLPQGFTSISDRRYILRPEAIESVFLLYRITGDPLLREKAWQMFTNISKYTKTEFANAALRDVTDPSAPKDDSMESFWTAETLKYFYLIFSEPDLISLDKFVFNTEAHPFKRP
ncbi:seven-hairpin glycosidase [Aureobasidium sp. EXF-10727]|nr:seven-hairpin glycosidase [Aureobasidium sp. EXF-10727]